MKAAIRAYSRKSCPRVSFQILSFQIAFTRVVIDVASRTLAGLIYSGSGRRLEKRADGTDLAGKNVPGNGYGIWTRGRWPGTRYLVLQFAFLKLLEVVLEVVRDLSGYVV